MKIVTPEVINDKRVIVRLDLDLDIDPQGQILDATRVTAAVPTLDLIKKNAKQLVLVGHRGRPHGTVDQALSLKPVIPLLSDLLGGRVSLQSFPSVPLAPASPYMLLENLRFYPQEEGNDPVFAQTLASLGDVFINEAFGTAHRTAASTVGIARLLPSFAGLHFAREVTELSTMLHNPIPPFVVIIGGAKLETKLPVIESLAETANAVLVGGLLAQEATKAPYLVQGKAPRPLPSNVVLAALRSDGLDIDSQSLERFTAIVGKAQSIVWNGPLGKIEDPNGQAGTKAIAQAIIDAGGYSIVGGGDTLGVLHQAGLLDKFDFVSVGGGAMLDFLSGHALPALEALE